MLNNKNDLTSCSLSYTFSAIGGKWKPFILWYLYDSAGTCRYGELKRKLPWDISHKMFSQQLSELVDCGIITRTEYAEKSPRVEYCLTEAGKLLVPAIIYLRDWGAVFNEKFDSDVIKRSLGSFNDTSLKYSYNSEELNKRINIEFEL